jgi:hypothetical protein
MKLNHLLLAILSLCFFACGKENTNPTPNDTTKVTLDAKTYKGLGNVLDGNYEVKGCLTIAADAQLTIKKGSKLTFNSNIGILVEEKGILTIEGEAGKSVTLTGKEAIEGYWEGITFEGSISNNNKISYCTLEYAGSTSQGCFTSGDNRAALVLGYIDAVGLISLDHLTISKSKEDGIYIGQGFDVTMKDCNISSSKGFPVKIDYANADVLSDNDNNNTFSGVGIKNYINIEGNDFAKGTTLDMTIAKQNIPYFLSSEFGINSKITINPGVTIVMGQNALLDLDNIASNTKANLICNGTAAEPIIFKGLESIANYWKGIDLTGSKLTMTNVKVSDCGSTADSFYGGGNACITLSRYYENVSKASIKNCSFSNYGASYAIQICTSKVPGGNDVLLEFNTDIESSNTFSGTKKVLKY